MDSETVEEYFPLTVLSCVRKIEAFTHVQTNGKFLAKFQWKIQLLAFFLLFFISFSQLFGETNLRLENFYFLIQTFLE